MSRSENSRFYKDPHGRNSRFLSRHIQVLSDFAEADITAWTAREGTNPFKGI